jgi:hypothetical protein
LREVDAEVFHGWDLAVRDDDGTDDLAEAGVGIAHDGYVSDQGMLVEGALDFDDRDVFAAADDQAFEPSGDSDAAIRAQPCEVSGVEPLVVDEAGLLEVGALEIPDCLGGARHL